MSKYDSQKIVLLEDIRNSKISVEMYDKEMEKLQMLTEDRSAFVRMELAKTAGLFCCDTSEQILLNLLYDKDMLVRIEAADSLSNFKSQRAFDALYSVVKGEKYYLLKAYSILSLAYTATSKNLAAARDILRDVIKSDSRRYVRLYCIEGLYFLGDTETSTTAVDDIFRIYLTSRNYRTRCAAIYVLYDIMDDNNQDKIKEFIRSHVEQESSYAVKERMFELICADLKE